MEGYVDHTMFFMDDGSDHAAPDPREARYQLAERLVDNIRFGEAIRILESLGDYGNSLVLLEQVRALKAYSDDEEDRRKAERRRQAREREMKEARERKRRRVFYAIVAAALLVVLFILK